MPQPPGVPKAGCSRWRSLEARVASTDGRLDEPRLRQRRALLLQERAELLRPLAGAAQGRVETLVKREQRRQQGVRTVVLDADRREAHYAAKHRALLREALGHPSGLAQVRGYHVVNLVRLLGDAFAVRGSPGTQELAESLIGQGDARLQVHKNEADLWGLPWQTRAGARRYQHRDGRRPLLAGQQRPALGARGQHRHVPDQHRRQHLPSPLAGDKVRLCQVHARERRGVHELVLRRGEYDIIHHFMHLLRRHLGTAIQVRVDQQPLATHFKEKGALVATQSGDAECAVIPKPLGLRGAAGDTPRPPCAPEILTADSA
mmetsp:Transcript_60546/g.172089  ORF Transcript_60546/g.172089 Transcript_60546/m.172089 type:complete len:318 (-) Transcript_60546:271-1224(-)